ncbi:WD40 domain-containing protein [Ordospora colligata]|uniref:WD40 domain-containing protein n=1 Tax=Ordospora colligata OC4 TaxID=1354746 RepID=A0A0B2UGD5_9MICR|nr:WD40 domain-containing protein [Ordospora colligata OC4]KHN70141.1 WD40 domain-containing protein [Ordospora colligata OC4]TBU16523.1 WD40 domain-containing protein [Ordospora colligata]TBU16564.1 WD40 domain-containing protein [Ordospora colligata]TBU19137.1 WD40 domain-containing protein [Ordospora colligata]
MPDAVLVEFEDEEGRSVSDRLHVPVSILRTQLQALANTQLSLYVNGQPLLESLDETLKVVGILSAEEIVKIRMCEDEPAAQAAFHCSSSFSGHEGPVLCVKYADVIATGGGDSTVRFWDPQTKTQSKIVKQHDHWVQCLDVSADGKYVASGALDGGICLYTADGEYVRSFPKHKKGVVVVKFYNGNLVTGSRDNAVIVWDLSGKVLASYAHSMAVTCICTGNDYLASGGKDARIKVYKNMKFFDELRGHAHGINAIDCNGIYMVSGCDGGEVIVWKDFVLCRRMKHKAEVISVSISSNRLYIASGSFDKTVKIWSLDTGQMMHSYSHVDFVYKVKMMNDLVASCSKDKMVKMFRMSKKKVVSEFVCDSEVYCFDVKDGELVCGTKSNRVYFFR